MCELVPQAFAASTARTWFTGLALRAVACRRSWSAQSAPGQGQSSSRRLLARCQPGLPVRTTLLNPGRSGPCEPENDHRDGQSETEQHADREQCRDPGPVADKPADPAVEDHAADEIAEVAPAVSLLRRTRLLHGSAAAGHDRGPGVRRCGQHW